MLFLYALLALPCYHRAIIFDWLYDATSIFCLSFSIMFLVVCGYAQKKYMATQKT